MDNDNPWFVKIFMALLGTILLSFTAIILSAAVRAVQIVFFDY